MANLDSCILRHLSVPLPTYHTLLYTMHVLYKWQRDVVKYACYGLAQSASILLSNILQLSVIAIDASVM